MTSFVPSFASTLPLTSMSAQCPRCEVLPAPLVGPGTLHLRFPLSHSRSKILSYLFNTPLECQQNGDTVSIAMPEPDLVPHIAPLMNVLSSVEQADVRVLFEPQGRAMELADYFEVDTLDGFLSKAQSGWLIEMMRQERLTTWFQPIVRSDAWNEVFAYECLMRGSEEAGMVPPGRIFGVARGAGLMFQLDRAARLTHIDNAARQHLVGTPTRVFINFMPTAIYDPVNCLSSTVKAVDECGLRREQVVFEVVESEMIHDVEHLKEILDYYRASGFGVALDDVGAGYSGLNMLGHLRPDFIKLDMQLVRDVHVDAYKATIVRKLLEIAQEIGARTICEGIEHEGEALWLRDNGADYVQGYFFGRPAPQIAG